MHSPPLSLHSKLGCLLFFTDICSSNNAYMPTPPYYLGVSQIQHRSPALRYRSPYLPNKIIFWAFLCLSLRFSPFLVQSLNFSYSEYGFLVTDNDYFWHQNYECEFLIVCTSCKTSYKGRTIRKVMGGGGWGKKIHARKKIHAKEKVKKKIHEEGRSNCDFFRKSEFQKSTILPGTIWINKNHFLLMKGDN